jgi:hypothetical protein
MSAHPYLKPNRLQDIIAAIQVMSLYERSSLQSEVWADRISGEKAKANYWEGVFSEHPEFFRRSPDREHRYALVWRRALARRFDRRFNRPLTDDELKVLPPEDMRFISRLPVSESQVQTLINIAITLHAKALENKHDYRWLIAQLTTLLAAGGGAIVGALLGTRQ